MKITKILLIFVCFFIFNSNIIAECTDSEIETIKEKANDLTITYEQIEPYTDFDSWLQKDVVINDAYVIKINGFTSDFYILINDYDYKNTSDTATDGFYSYKIYDNIVDYHIYSTKCDVLLKNVHLYLPKYNYYAYRDECNNKPLLKECSKWIKEEDYDYFINLEEDKFNEIIEEYDEQNIVEKALVIINENKKIIAIVLGSILLIAIVLIIVAIKRKRSRLE